MKGQTIQAKLTCQNNQAKKSTGRFESISFIIDKKIVLAAMISFTELQVLFLLCMTTYVHKWSKNPIDLKSTFQMKNDPRAAV